MPNPISFPPVVTPSKKGSAPVKDVLQKIRIRELKRALSEESRHPSEELSDEGPGAWTVFFLIATLIASGIALVNNWNVDQSMRRAKIEMATPMMYRPSAVLTAPMGVHPVPTVAVQFPAVGSELLVPADIHPSPQSAHPKG